MKMKKGKTQVQDQIIKKQKISKSNPNGDDPIFDHTIRSSCDALSQPFEVTRFKVIMMRLLK